MAARWDFDERAEIDRAAVRSGPPLEEEAAVGVVGVDAHSKDTALEVGVSANNVEALLGLVHVLSGDRADDGSAEDVVFRIVRRAS